MNDLGNREIMAQNIQRLMDKTGKTRMEVCDDLGLKYTTFTDWVNGKTYPRIDKIEMMAKYFGVSKSDLVEKTTIEDAKRGLAVIKYLEEMGFTVSGYILQSHFEHQIDESGNILGKSEIADEFGTVLSKEGHSAIFTDAEFEELQAAAKEAIEGRFYKKVLEQQNRRSGTNDDSHR